MYSPKLIEETLRVWQPYFKRQLTANDAEEIIQRWSSFLRLIGNSLPRILEAQDEEDILNCPKNAE